MRKPFDVFAEGHFFRKSVKAIDEKDACFRLQEGEEEPGRMYDLLKQLLRGPTEGSRQPSPLFPISRSRG